MVALLVVAIAVDDGPRGRSADPASVTEPTSSPSPTTPTATPVPIVTPTALACLYLPEGVAARPVTPPSAQPGPQPRLAAVLKTSVGDIDLLLDARTAPCAVHSLRTLAEAGFYDDTPCHRLVDKGIFVLQCGDPTGTGSGGPGYRFAEEALRDARYPRGTVAMVNSGPGTTGSQFFLVYDDSPLPAQYTPVGTIGEAGLAVLDQVAAAGVGPVNDAGVTPPLTTVQLLSVEFTPLATQP